MKDIVVLYHKNCPDGFGAAFAAWKKFGGKAEYKGVFHTDPVVEGLVDKEVYCVDFCYPEEVMRALVIKNKKVVVLDHHVSLERAIKSVPEHRYALDHSGAVLAWTYLHPEKKVPWLLRYVEDVDLWKFKLRETNEAMAFVELHEYGFAVWDKLAALFDDRKKREECMEKGRLLLLYKRHIIKSIIEKCKVLVEFEGYKIFAVNSSKFNSDIGAALYKERPPVGIVWEQIGDTFGISLRSDGTVDVAEIAGKYGGGGHKAASRFHIPVKKGFPWKIIDWKK